jgi:hypothetical protein
MYYWLHVNGGIFSVPDSAINSMPGGASESRYFDNMVVTAYVWEDHDEDDGRVTLRGTSGAPPVLPREN